VLLVDALPGGRACDLLDLASLGVAVQFVVVAGSGERVIIGRGLHRLALEVRSGTLTGGPVRLRYALEGFDRLSHPLATLQALVALRRLRRMPVGLFARERRAARWILHLRVLDALNAGATQREIGEILFPAAGGRWRGRSDFLRLRVQRLVRNARSLSAGGYRELLLGPAD
jgi:hypothetical protein